MDWTNALPDLAPRHRAALATLPARDIGKGSTLFRAGENAAGFVVVLRGRIDVYLTAANGREILLYTVEPGQSCVQTTLGLLGSEEYTGQAVAGTDLRLVVIPKPVFLDLMDSDPAFRGFVLSSFARRMQDVTRLLERVAFGRIEARLAATLLALESNGVVTATHAELAARIGSAREVVTRRIDGFARQGWVGTDRGEVRLHDPEALRRLAASLE